MRKDNGSRNVSAELVAVVLRQRAGSGEVVLRSRNAVAVDLKQHAVEVVSASAGDNDNLRGLCELGRGAGRHRLKLAYAIKRRILAVAALQKGAGVRCAIDREAG